MCEPDQAPTRDAGTTFPEVIVTVVVLSMLVAVMSSALVVTMRQRDNTEGRVNVAAAEQSIGLRLPNDLASAASATRNEGSLTLRWTDPDGGTTEVRYEHDPDAEVVTRTACSATCGPPVVVARGATTFDASATALTEVVIGVDGGGDVDGAGGGLNAIALTAAVAERTEIDHTSTRNAPTLANLCAAGYVTEGCP